MAVDLEAGHHEHEHENEHMHGHREEKAGFWLSPAQRHKWGEHQVRKSSIHTPRFAL